MTILRKLYIIKRSRMSKGPFMRMWFNGRTPASQAGNGGSIPLIRSRWKTRQNAVFQASGGFSFFDVRLRAVNFPKAD